jgi:dolichyl-phosphate-mannose--protein O-mannosyl transferase
MYRTVKQYSYVTSIGMGVVTLKEIEALFGVDVVPFVVSCLYSLLVSLLVVFLCSLLV